MFIIFSIGEEDINVLIKIVKLEYLLATPISLYMWIYESVKAGKWFVYKRSLPFVLVIMLLVYAIMILLIWWIYKRRSLNKKWPTYIEDERYYLLEDSLLRLLSFSILTIPIFTIGTIIITVKGLK
ncbi:hypothetical protein [Tepidibacter aestuarii]|uniref:hypothetical protein n=1 Tax=Tepidibacter aestuarii TaxID=2925782 RepID=UPI0020C0CDEE|nr:hypothetical protein [Tepidibacter aestuarii]